MFNLGKIKELTDRAEKAEHEFSVLSDMYKASQTVVVEQKERILAGEKAFIAIQKERDNLKEMVREQTGADLLINSLKSLGIIKEEQKVDHFAEQKRLHSVQSQLAMMNTANPYGGYYGGGLLGALSGAGSQRAF